MRHPHLLAAGAVMAVAASAGAQTRTPAPDPSPRAYIAGDRFDVAPRAALGINTSSTGTLRDTLGLLVSSVVRGGPAEKAGLEEGNRIASINGVNLRSTKVDLEDYESAGTLNRRLVRELEKVKPGQEVDLRVYRGGRTEALKVRTVSSDSLFPTRMVRRFSRSDFEDRPALGIGLGSTGSRRDTLGVLVMSVVDSSPAARAGLEEGNRIAAINGVNLRVAHEDADDPGVGGAKAERLHREVSQLKVGDNVTLRVYASGQWRDVTMKVVRAGDLPRSRRSMYFGDMMMPPMPAMPAMPSMPAVPPMPPSGRMYRAAPIEFELGPEIREQLEGVRVKLDEMRPEIERIKGELPRLMEKIPDVRVKLDWGTTTI
ncbi:MAG: PDZ domain-containing protein [Gemmatimonadetes bacterium]|nr:PDZ domain-containing protein [Gemmatimonadota bacterium]